MNVVDNATERSRIYYTCDAFSTLSSPFIAFGATSFHIVVAKSLTYLSKTASFSAPLLTSHIPIPHSQYVLHEKLKPPPFLMETQYTNLLSNKVRFYHLLLYLRQ